MKRRTITAPVLSPDRLRRFRPEEWRGIGCHPECAFRAALRRWQDDHNGQQPAVWQPVPRTFYREHL